MKQKPFWGVIILWRKRRCLGKHFTLVSQRAMAYKVASLKNAINSSGAASGCPTGFSTSLFLERYGTDLFNSLMEEWL